MRIKKTIFIFSLIFLVSCSQNYYERIYKRTYMIDEIVKINEEIIKTSNPAKKTLYSRKFNKSLVKLDNVLVKDIIRSQEVDYEFCIVADVKHEEKLIQCFIFSKNIKAMAKLEKNKTIISVLGDFHRTYKIFDEYYLKIEIFESSISIKNEEKNN